MTAISKPTKDTRFLKTMDEALVVRKGELDPLIDRVNSITTSDGKITLNEVGSVAAPSITAPGGVAGLYITGATVGLSTAGSHYALLTGSGALTVYAGAGTTGGINTNVTNSQVPVYLDVVQGNITAGTGGAIPITNYCTTINTDGPGDAYTLADGACIGQLKKIILLVDGGGDGVVTGKFGATGASTTLTFSDAGEYAILMWNGAGWVGLELLSQLNMAHSPVIS